MLKASLSEPPWQRPHGLDSVVDRWLESNSVRPCICSERLLPARKAGFAAFPEHLSRELVAALRTQGVEALYSHQRTAIDAALALQHTVLATPTSSGKSLCFHLPVLDTIAREPAASALYLYPTKALARDQEQSLCSLIEKAKLPVPAMVFDGDTPGDLRRQAREKARIVLTNPDMLHVGILPNHSRWASLFQSLRYVVIDELHVYRGVFGSHLAHVIARLLRIARFHGSAPTFLGATATIGNPRAHAARLFGVEAKIALVEESGAPTAPKRVFIYNPPLVNAKLGVRGSALKHAVELTADLVKANVPSIVFGPSRNSVEVMLKYLRQKTTGIVAKEALMAYRGGYLPETRRRIEQRLRDGEIVGVVATNALELGIDIGELEAVVCVGYPGSIAALWQRFGRSGRRHQGSIAVLVCNNDAVDQFLAHSPDHLFGARAEEARIDPINLEILLQHLKCACFEQPFCVADSSSFESEPSEVENYAGLDAETTREALSYLASHQLVHRHKDRYLWVGEAFPATHISLRSVGWHNFVIVDVESELSIAELDWRASHTMLHEQAIYQQDGEQYQVERLDYDNHKAFVRKVTPDYFTSALTYRTVEVLEQHATAPLGKLIKGVGDVKVLEKVTGYKKIKFFTHENAGYGEVHLPEMQMHTVSFWLTLPEFALRALPYPRATIVDALRGAGAVLETVSAFALMCDRQDLRRTLRDGSDSALVVEPPDSNGTRADSNGTREKPQSQAPLSDVGTAFQPTLYLFDAVPGGVGLAPRIYDLAHELVERARQLIAACPCKLGCPACIGPRRERSEPIADKKLARELLALAE